MSGQIPVRDVTPAPKKGDENPKEPFSFYLKQKRIQPKWVEGRFQLIRDYTVFATMGAYLITPWLSWGGEPLVLFDLPGRRFNILGQTFFPSDFFFLSLILMIAGFALLFFTNLFGRVFCGYVCPQTVWTRFFVRIERITEGDRPARLKLDAAHWGAEKILRRGGKHVLWLLLAVLTALTFVGYFSPIQDLTWRLATFQLGGWETWWIVFFATATYMNAGWMREQVCLYMCPYARFQSAMFDRDTLVVSYDTGRGEPRGRGKKRRDTSTEHRDLGDCIDCGLCVQVCPTGIDIRDGLQYECITCAACIDACDEVMDSIGKPRGLVRYTTETILEGGRLHLVRPRSLGYGVVVGSLIAVLLLGLLTRVPLEVEVIRDRNALFQMTDDGKIENAYTLKVYNKTKSERAFTIRLEGAPGVVYSGPGLINVPSSGSLGVPVSVLLDPDEVAPSNSDLYFVVAAQDDDKVVQRIESRFIAGGR